MLYITSRRRIFYELLVISKMVSFFCNNNLSFKVHTGIVLFILAELKNKEIQRCLEQKKLFFWNLFYFRLHSVSLIFESLIFFAINIIKLFTFFKFQVILVSFFKRCFDYTKSIAMLIDIQSTMPKIAQKIQFGNRKKISLCLVMQQKSPYDGNEGRRKQQKMNVPLHQNVF